jgi:hypothetical protein
MRQTIDFQNEQPTNILAQLLVTTRRPQLRQTIDFQKQPTNILAQLLVTTRRPQSEWRIGDVVGSPEQSSQHDHWRAAA